MCDHGCRHLNVYLFTTAQGYQTERPSMREVEELGRRGSKEEGRKGGKRRGKEERDREMEMREEGMRKTPEKKKSESRREF